jgi:hypothetical protein
MQLHTGFGGAAKSTTEKNKRRTLQSLFIIVCIYVGTWFVTVIVNSVIILFGLFILAMVIIVWGSLNHKQYL